ncbi:MULTISPECIES: hypothetical protein [Streptomyces]|uniref:Apea-like HEPN domain-containing protein n=1 Tax=Streptomyces clavifer TaxID=68188 RepID=A0ABS4VI26_9ACTN|nr:MULTISPECIES: hypothetical protein [Streptomyces]MBP2363575.1 hypothetical protein [Streptomyces clavifer]MDX2748442.1 hypothetical protein [Streptomyces sp. NRRL_B-2557]GHB18982.1 hypothetical protein GCM10010392_54550 [Streptomyces clavifer]
MQELRFDDIRFTTAVGSDQTWLRRALGGHELSVQLAVGVSPFAEAGKILALEAELFGFGTAPAQRSRLGRTTANLAYTPVVTLHRVNLVFPLTSLQVHAIEEARTGDVRFEIDLNATLPQAAGYPGCAPATEIITLAKSTWEQQIAQLGPSAAFEMAVPFPFSDPQRAEVGRLLREAQRLLTTGEIRASILEIRRALEWIQHNVDWDRPGSKKLANQCNQTERWWRIQDALYSQTSGAMHNDPVTKDFSYDRAEAETLLAMTAALLRNVPGAPMPRP